MLLTVSAAFVTFIYFARDDETYEFWRAVESGHVPMGYGEDDDDDDDDDEEYDDEEDEVKAKK